MPADRGGHMHLRETTAATLTEAAVTQNGNVLLRLIAPGWSRNGRYYSEDLLKADGLQAFREGTQTYLDHPTRTEQVDRPERSVRDLVGTLTENAYYDPNGPAGPGLYARASVRDEYRPLVEELREVIGISIRADGTGHLGEADGRQGTIIDSIGAAESVDYVTTPAAGGRVIQLIESVQNPDRETVEPEPATDEPLAEADTPDAGDAGALCESCQARLTETTETPPADPAGPNADPSAPIEESTSPSEEDTMTGTPGAGTAPAQTPRSLMEAEIANMRRENATLRARERARSIIAGVLSEGWLVPAQIAPITESLLTDLPLTESLELDEQRLIAAATRERESAEQVGFQVSEALGVGRPRDLGHTDTNVGDPALTDKFTQRLEGAFTDLGLSEAAVKTAARGRN